MEAVKSPVPSLNSESCLPPRKRLLVGLKRKNECPPPLSSLSSSSRSSASSTSFSVSSSSSLSPPSMSSVSSEFSVRIRDFLYGNARFSLSPEEMIEVSKSAAVAAAKIAAAAKATALEKAAAATKAAAAAKRALELVASASDKALRTVPRRKKKLKKHIPIKLLYKKREAGKSKGTANSPIRKNNRPVLLDMKYAEVNLKEIAQDEDLGTHKHVDDEELALQLHRAMNCSPRISKKTMITSPQTDRRANFLEYHKEVIPRKKHKGPKFVSLENIQINFNPQNVKAQMTSLPDVNGRVYVPSEQSTSTEENDSIRGSISTRPLNQYRYQSDKERQSRLGFEGVSDHFMIYDKQQIDTLWADSLSRASYSGSKGAVSPSSIGKSEDLSLPLEFGQCSKSQVLHQEGLQTEDSSSVEAIESQSHDDRLKSENCHKAIITTTASDQQASSEPYFIGKYKKCLFPQTQCILASQSLCFQHTNSTVTAGHSSIKVDE